MRKAITIILLLCVTMLSAQESKSKIMMSNAKEKVTDYDYYELRADMSRLTNSERELIPIFIEIAASVLPCRRRSVSRTAGP